MAIAWQ